MVSLLCPGGVEFLSLTLCYNPRFASNSLSCNALGVPGLKRTFSALFVSMLLIGGLSSCGSSSRTTTSGLKFRAFISNPLNPTISGSIFPGLNIADATRDVLSPFSVSLSGTTTSAGMMVESPKRDRTVVFSPVTNTSTNVLAIVDNAKESATGSVNLPGATESMFITGDSTTLFAAIPTAAVPGQSAGAVVQINLSTPAITATIPIAGARFIIPGPNGNQLLVISDTANSVTVLSPGLISSGGGVTPVPFVFDRPAWAVFSADGTSAYVMNCGPECGGTTASIAVVDLTQTPPAVTSTVPVAAATFGLISGGNLYVSGTPPNTGVDCQANLCGALTIFSAANLAATPLSLAITDGYHNHMVMAPNGQLFVGSRTCTDIIQNPATSTPGRGCLSVVNTSAGTVYTASQNGDVTAIEPIDNRPVVYVCEGGALQIYDTANDLGTGKQLELQKTQIAITGQAIDVKLADF